MKQPYKQKIGDLLQACQFRLDLIDRMIDGSKKAEPKEAQRYVKEITNGLQKIQEIVDIS